MRQRSPRADYEDRLGVPRESDGLPWWTGQRVRLSVLLSLLAVLVFCLVVTRVGLLGLGGTSPSDALGGVWAQGCPMRAAPPVATAASDELLGLREDLRRVVRGLSHRRLYSLGSVTSDNAWTDNSPQGGAGRLVVSAGVPGAYEMRWWVTGTDLVADVFVFDRTSQAGDFFELASSPRCRPWGALILASSPPGAREVVWRNPDRAFQEDVFLQRGNRVYRVSDVRAQNGVSQDRSEQQRGFAVASGLACALPEADCRAAKRQRDLALMSLTQQ